ncbi:MAG: 23S rRNA (uracil(1939)-C(5))-methyltransferase RlmD [Bacilli bacterium]|nr:23S rRNA (uracil(1939)-C(5))-methyltransferase RlmD [Bacilli bacterium]
MNGEEYEIKIERFDHEARGIGYILGKIAFVDNVVPGDIVLAKIIKSKKNYYIAKVTKFLKYSSDRLIAICPYFGKCGGCDLQYINYNHQLIFKENKVKDIMLKFANVDNFKIKPILCIDDNIFYYRNKVTFQVKKEIGLFSRNSYELIAIDKCYIASKQINDILMIIKKKITLDNIEQIIIKSSFYNSKVMVIFVGNNLDLNNLKRIKNDVSSIYVVENNIYNLLNGESYLQEKLDNYIFEISPDSFFQVNPKMCVKLYDKIIEYGNFSGNETVLDLYCGTGTIGIYISKFVKKVIGYEINKYAVNDAINNAKINLVDNIEFVCGSSELSFSNVTHDINIIIADPPRNGLNKETINGIISVKPCKVIYVSCDPITLARDLKLLSDFYDLIEITPVDMFPNTKHVECVSLLKLKML